MTRISRSILGFVLIPLMRNVLEADSWRPHT